MKTEKMTPQWVVENFLPDYQERYGDYYEVDIDDDLSPDYELEYPDWINKHFPEALSELLKAQRQECADSYLSLDPFGGVPKVMIAIIDSTFPEPKNRK